ncbi:MAG: hypothetical protein H6Q14_1385 [Bacteroidetes bacterium]|nr:hypothetical protein [Bacteroidota bacterium]
MFKPPYLQPYKGKATRHICPACGSKESFTLYLNGETHEPINPKVGKCNRESKCGYHYTPKQFFIDNPSPHVETLHATSKYNAFKQIEPPKPIGTIPFSYVERSASYQSNFVRFLCEFMTTEQMTWIGEIYALGATKNKEVIFWQIDITGKVRTGKIMQYNPESGKRIKHESGAIDWVHNKLKQTKQLPEDFNLQQCFFGEHLLKLYQTKTVAIVESEKSAVIACVFFPDLIWIAAGNINGLSIDKCKVLKGRKAILFPDLNAFDKWTEKAKEIQIACNCKIKVSTLLEDSATQKDKENGFDIADYIINQEKTIDTINNFSSQLNFMIKKNPTILKLINTLDLIEA